MADFKLYIKIRTEAGTSELTELELFENESIRIESVNYIDYLFNLEKFEYQRTNNIEVPMTDKNKSIFRFPDNLLTDRHLMRITYTAIVSIGTVQIEGTLYILDWDLEKINTTFVYSFIKDDRLFKFKEKIANILNIPDGFLEYPHNIGDTLINQPPQLADYSFTYYEDIRINLFYCYFNLQQHEAFVPGIALTYSLEFLMRLFFSEILWDFRIDGEIFQLVKNIGLNVPVWKLGDVKLPMFMGIGNQNECAAQIFPSYCSYDKNIIAQYFDFLKGNKNYAYRYLDSNGVEKFGPMPAAFKVKRTCRIIKNYNPIIFPGMQNNGAIIRSRHGNENYLIFDVKQPEDSIYFKDEIISILRVSDFHTDPNNSELVLITNPDYDPTNVFLYCDFTIMDSFYPRVRVDVTKNLPDITFCDILLLYRHITGTSIVFDFKQKTVNLLKSFHFYNMGDYTPVKIDDKLLKINSFKMDWDEMEGTRMYHYETPKEYKDEGIWKNRKKDFPNSHIVSIGYKYSDDNLNFKEEEVIENKAFDPGVLVYLTDGSEPSKRLFIYHTDETGEIKNKLPTVGRYIPMAYPYPGLLEIILNRFEDDVIRRELLKIDDSGRVPLMIEVEVFMYFFEYMNITFPMLYFRNSMFFIVKSSWSDNVATFTLNLIN